MAITTPPQSAGELPLPGIERQADPAPCPAQRVDITSQTTEREVVPLRPGITPTDQTESRPAAATTPHNPPRPSEEAGGPRREVRRPVKYQDYECYTLQPVQGDMATKNPVYKEELVSKEIANRNPVYEKKELIFQEKSVKEKFNYLDQSGASDYLDQSGASDFVDQSEASKHRQTWSPSWTCAHLDSDMLPVNTAYEKLTNIVNSKLDMDKDKSKDTEEIERILKELMEDPPVIEGQLKTPTKQKNNGKPWWLTEESLVGEVELDYSAVDKTTIKEAKVKEEVKSATPKPTPVMTVQRNGLIAKKELSATHLGGQHLATGDATPLEGLSTGAETGPVDSSIEKERAVPPIRNQQMGRCSVQRIRLIDEPTPPVIEKPGQLFWTTPETDQAVKDLMEEPDVTRQRCSECGFRGTKKRVHIHCTQHFCRHFCECGLMKASRDAIYDHQVSKYGEKGHGGPTRQIYCVDRLSYPAFCSAMGWEDPPPQSSGSLGPLEKDLQTRLPETSIPQFPQQKETL